MRTTTAAPMIVYLSSTLTDLAAERAAVKEVLGGTCVVRESYEPSDANLVSKCLEDVSTSEIYIGIVGLRYGFVPPGQTVSITQLEYEHAKRRGLRRLLFLKNEDAIAFSRTDASTKEHPVDVIQGFRAQLSSGADDEPTPGRFGTVDQLKLAVQGAISKVQAAKSQVTTLMKGEPLHPWTVLYETAVACVPGTDEQMQATLQALARADRRIALFDLSPAQPADYLFTLDTQVRRSRSVMMLVTAASLSRLTSAAALVGASLEVVRPRTAGVFGLLVDVKADALPPAIAAQLTDVFETTTADWTAAQGTATFDTLQQWRRARAPEAPVGTRVAVPYIIATMNEAEAQSLSGGTPFFQPFGTEEATVRQSQFDALRTSVGALSPNWPQGFYGAARGEWRPFGEGTGAGPQTMHEFLQAAVRRVNEAAPGSRERRLLKNAQITLLPYAFDEYLNDRAGSRENVRRVCDLGCLILVDEFALLHPVLRGRIDQLLGSNNAAVVSISACDPTPRRMKDLTADLSYLHVGNLVVRFRNQEDPRCELALNSVERLQRWLRLVLPELLTTLGQEQIDPALVKDIDALLDVPAGAQP